MTTIASVVSISSSSDSRAAIAVLSARLSLAISLGRPGYRNGLRALAGRRRARRTGPRKGFSRPNLARLFSGCAAALSHPNLAPAPVSDCVGVFSIGADRVIGSIIDQPSRSVYEPAVCSRGAQLENADAARRQRYSFQRRPG